MKVLWLLLRLSFDSKMQVSRQNRNTWQVCEEASVKMKHPLKMNLKLKRILEDLFHENLGPFHMQSLINSHVFCWNFVRSIKPLKNDLSMWLKN